MILLALGGAPLAWASDGTGLQLEADPAADTPARNPLRSWKAALPQLPDGARIRRIAFAGHGMFIFFSPAGEDAILGQFFHWRDGILQADPADPRPPDICSATGTRPEQVAPALERVLRSTEWQRHAARLDSLILECHRPELFWMLMPVPEGGYREGVAITTYDVKFEPTASPSLDLER
jgi:hypothetical protein